MLAPQTPPPSHDLFLKSIVGLIVIAAIFLICAHAISPSTGTEGALYVAYFLLAPIVGVYATCTFLVKRPPSP